MNNLFAQSRSHWVRYDRYEIKTGKDGKRYITPEKAAKPDVYNPLKESPEMVLEALNVGMLMMNRRSEDEVEKAILAFVTHYGLLGLMTALPTTPSFMDYEAVYLPKNHFIKEESMETDDYLALFYPFDKLDVVKKGVESNWNVSGGRTMIALTMTFMEEPMAENMSFQREYSGSLIILLNEGVGFVKRNMKTRWKKTADSRIEMPDYCERSVFEALVNALIHRDYLILGSEVHIDIYDDRLTIYSPGGMPDGTRIQERDLSSISSTRRNPVLADIFGRLGYMERQGSGFKKITETYRAAHNYRDELEPKFYSDASSFQVTLYNLNYGTAATANKVTIEDENVAIEVAIDRLNASQGTIAKAKAVFANMGADGVFGRSDIAAITKDSVTAAGNLITKLKNADLIEPVSGFGKGKYKFIAPKE